MTEVSTSKECLLGACKRSGPTHPRPRRLLYAHLNSSCYQLCTDLMTYRMDASGMNKSLVWAACSPKENGKAESFTGAKVHDTKVTFERECDVVVSQQEENVKGNRIFNLQSNFIKNM